LIIAIVSAGSKTGFAAVWQVQVSRKTDIIDIQGGRNQQVGIIYTMMANLAVVDGNLIRDWLFRLFNQRASKKRETWSAICILV